VRTFFDTSSFAKRYVEEKGSQQVDEICRKASELSLSVICVPEIISALNQRRREKVLTQQDYSIIKRHLSIDVRDAVIINLTIDVIAVSALLLEASPLRAMDALHIACALEWDAELFVTSDKQQISAAKKAGLYTKYV
jgi:uncharacterized protein